MQVYPLDAALPEGEPIRLKCGKAIQYPGVLQDTLAQVASAAAYDHHPLSHTRQCSDGKAVRRRDVAGDLFRHVHHPAGFVGLATMRHGCEVRRVGLDQQALERHPLCHLLELLCTAKGDDTGEGDIKTQRQRAFGDSHNAEAAASSLPAADRLGHHFRIVGKLGQEDDVGATGQTGVLIAERGLVIDAVISDFVSGAAEWLSPANEPGHWDLIEGQGSLFHPSYAAVTLGLIHGSQPDALVLCHETGRRHIGNGDLESGRQQDRALAGAHAQSDGRD